MPTFVAYQIYVSPVAGDADGMILHPRAAANIPDDNDLDMVIFRVV